MREPNKAILRSRHITPTLDDMILDLNGSKVFSKMDLRSGYHQLELNEESRNITTFTTHVGLRRYKRLSFGVSSAAELFQNTLSNALEGLDGVRNISDDIIVFGRNQDEHDKRLEKLFARLKEKNLTLNKAKCEFNKNKLEFYGHIFSADGISADPRKISAIRNTTIPKDDSKWEWTSEQQESFDKLKNELVADRVMSYFDPNKETMLIVDASPVGLAGLLTQNGKIIAYASRSLTDVETRYSQTEKEALAIVWAIEHFHLYLYGQSFTLVSDHQPLETIFNSPKAKTPARIERWRLRLQGYNFKVQYKPGKVNAA
ncbi:protein SFI1 [Mytilus galloprovincialis]|uniref:Protein SFI1 n=1 Tax=Mytilus galloprovincialis TaxID=29158 RepID=A0A8B6D5M6_MYTGA|nr:protein SFI1 [Mytilus galloprovincialis]